MRLVVELYGLARHLTGATETMVEVDEGATLRDVARAVGLVFPQLVGPIVEAQTSELVDPYVFSLDGRVVSPTLDVPARPGERLVLMFVPAGG
ncbi:MAG: MoaD/ThiS family protein [Chloroflexota bacterium]